MLTKVFVGPPVLADIPNLGINGAQENRRSPLTRAQCLIVVQKYPPVSHSGD